MLKLLAPVDQVPRECRGRLAVAGLHQLEQALGRRQNTLQTQNPVQFLRQRILTAVLRRGAQRDNIGTPKSVFRLAVQSNQLSKLSLSRRGKRSLDALGVTQ